LEIGLHENDNAMVAETRQHDTEISAQSRAFSINEWVAVKYDGKWYIGKVIAVDSNECEVTFMQRVKSKFKWPSTEDKLWVPFNNIICSIPEPTASGRCKRQYELADDIIRTIDNNHKTAKK
jgi:hypothetical protein